MDVNYFRFYSVNSPIKSESGFSGFSGFYEWMLIILGFILLILKF